MTWQSGDPRTLRVVVAGGGTGGHLYPGIAVAREILRRDATARISFAGTAHGIEARVVPQEGFEFDVIRSAGLKGKSWTLRIRGLCLVPLSLFDAWRLLSRRRPRVVVGVGGYSSGPVVMSAALRGVPTVVLEQNAVPGLTNRMLARWVGAAAVAYDDTRSYFGGKGFVSGNPVRPEFHDAARAPRSDASVPNRRLLVFGGSQGAHVINRAMADAAGEVAGLGADVIHQTGARDVAMVRAAYAGARVAARVEEFLDPIAPEMAAAALVVCRAGATTLAELAALGRPAVLVPLASATDDHQRKNAAALERAGAALVIDERDLSGSRLVTTIESLFDDPARLERMGKAMRGFARPDAAACIVDRLEELVAARG